MNSRPRKRRGPIYFMLDAWRDDRTDFMANVVIAVSAWMLLAFLLFLICGALVSIPSETGRPDK
jgi:hypothetical protein